ncbi:nidogen-2 isoform X2 [Hemibagrus wyckioides]|uniref:nidogen-2 isoform X2 n=1 Tax=Hemibagrus wyckioides TaxID=337641 RepID=UPI00266D1397|nr:nidogen-2 isoform X2 [Hemibagrus wyckioides]
MWKKAAAFLIQLSCISQHVSALQRGELFPYGPLNGDLTLQEGDDETSQVIALSKPMRFYDTSFSKLYVATNGIISPHDLPMEKQYVDDGFPTEFPVIAPFLADIDTSNGKGVIYYRQTESPNVLNRVAAEVQKGFPGTQFTPTHAVIATWENVAAYKVDMLTTESSRQVNTFQAVVAYDEENTYALFLYPEDGLQFFGTLPKEMFNVEIELPARVGFTRGEISYLVFGRTEGPYFSLTSNEQSVKNLYQTSNTNVPGVWLFHIGNAHSFVNVIPATFSGRLLTTVPQKQMLRTTPEYPPGEYDTEDDSFDDEQEYNIDRDFPNTDTTEFPQPDHDAPRMSGQSQEGDSNLFLLNHYEVKVTLSPDPQTEHTTPTNVPTEEVVDSVHPVPKHPLLEAYPVHPEGEVVNVEDDVHFDTGVFRYSTPNKETCDRFQQTCSQNAYCADYPSGYCCHCNAGFYGNGRHCLPDGAPQRVNGKVNGMVSVGSTPVGLNSIDLHVYIVVGDGRAYTAISEVPEPLGWALMPVTPIGGLFGWLFALKLPNSRNGFNVTGAEFTRHADVTFYPGNQRLTIVQTAKGLDNQNYLNVETHLEGSVPFVPPGASIQMEPFSETYQYYPSLITSNSVREFTIVSALSGAEKFTYQLRQNITYKDCRHTLHPGAETLQLNVERIFAMYVKEERVLRYAITNKIGRVGDYVQEPQQGNPCYLGSHDCDTTAQCVPGEGQHFTCVCATGYTGDGRNCYDVDECTEGLSSCGSHAQCVNLPGSHSCQCQSGFEYGHDSRTCIDVDECRRHPCHPHASCTNVVGSFQCQCQPGFHGDGFQCHVEERPKTQCEHHRDSVQSGVDGLSVHGTYVPQCDEQGQYRPQQCHGSTGYCWCVDSRGQERAGTRTPPGTPAHNCDAPDRPKTQCEQHRDSTRTEVDGLPVHGAYVPQCDEQGHYRPRQCHASTGHCWCVDSRGQERAGTRTPPGTPPTNCDAPERLKTQCERHRDNAQVRPGGIPLAGVFIPDCDEEGNYRPRQCHSSSGYCWCVDSRGQERVGTHSPPGAPFINCDAPERPKTQCERHRHSAQHGTDGVPVLGAFIPECDEEGRYRSLQCHSSTGHCWCVDSRGQERVGTRTPPGTQPTDCDAPVHPERPKTACEEHRDSVKARVNSLGIVGAFIPQCDEEGRYKSKQCHGSTGHCWCVDSAGQERAGTRTPPGTPNVDCDATVHPERPKTTCEEHRDSVKARVNSLGIVGAFIPQCDEEGRYKSEQCHGSTGHCWCVDSAGQERAGTRTPPGTPNVDCDATVHPERPKTACEEHRDSVKARVNSLGIVGAFIPQCDEEGRYKSEQCHGSTGHCWCVDSAGQERAGTRTPPGTPNVDCDATVHPERPKTTCEEHRDSVKARVNSLGIVGAFIPQCDEEGRYKSEQCHGSTGHCWCVDIAGQERAGTRTPPGTPNVDCDATVHPERPKTTCEEHRDSVKARVNSLGIVGAFIPQCDEEGRYKSVQCHGSTGHCWCVDSAGQERAGTRTPPGTPNVDCDATDHPERAKTACEEQRDTVKSRMNRLGNVGAYIPQCDEEGRYKSLQCHGSTGYCWCVDSAGQERAGTRTPPGTPNVDCDAPERPKSQCEQHRDSIHGRGDGLRLTGAYVPQCDEEGRYKSVQCHGSTGHCWCVDSAGQERAGTRTPPGTPNVDCDATERPKTQCEQHRDSIRGRGDGLPLIGPYVPQCDEEGRYKSLQCHGSTGHCWCVDSAGQERAGTRTPPGTPNVNCDAPERPKTQCEQHRDRSQSRPDGSPAVGAFIPQCDEEGQYRSLQCHGSTGHCWCVDSRGQERPGTRTPPGSPRRNCDAPVEVVPSPRPETVCERWRASLMARYGGRPGPENFLPQCDESGEFTPVQCYGESNYCWCVDRHGREVPGTRSHDKVKPACIPTVPPPTMRPLPRTDVTPPPSGTTLLYAQGQQIGSLPLNGTRMDKERSSVLLSLHGSIVVGIDYDCRERKVYWTDLAGRTISRASLEPGSEPEILINSGLMSPEGLAVDQVRRRMFWVDSAPDKIETAKLDGSDRRILFSTDLVNPRAIVVDSLSGTLYWTDWNREAPKIESSTVEGHNRRILVQDGIGLPNALTIDPTTRRICWADAGTKSLECIAPDGTGRHVIRSELNYPFSMVFYANHFYYTDWRRDGVIGLSRDSSHFTDEYLPDQRSHLYGITVAPSSCL